MFIILALYVFNDHDIQKAIDILSQLSDLSLEEEGCAAFDVSRSIVRHNEFMIYEMYQDEQAFEDHKKSEHFKRYALDGLHQFCVGKSTGFYQSVDKEGKP